MLTDSPYSRALTDTSGPGGAYDKPPAFSAFPSCLDKITREPANAAIYFLHIDKTAGTSVHKFLTDRFARSAICPARRIGDIDGASAESLKSYTLFSGHFTGGFGDFLGSPLRTITLLRDPIQRSISQYAHTRRDPVAPHHKLALTMSLREFCLHPETQNLIQDFQARCLTGQAQDAPVRRVIMAPRPRTGEEKDRLLRQARARLATCAAIGATEHLSTTLALICATLGLDRPTVAPYENASYNKPKSIDRDTLSIIRELTPCDAVLHQEAVRLLFARARDAGLAVPDPVAAQKTRAGGESAFQVRDRITAARATWPEREHRAKLALSNLICALPRVVRRTLVLPYTVYRLSIDKSVPPVRRLPLLLGAIYLILPIGPAIPGHLDKIAGPIVGFLFSAALSGRAKMRDLKFAAISRFDL
jgi:hypothetical protein